MPHLRLPCEQAPPVSRTRSSTSMRFVPAAVLFDHGGPRSVQSIGLGLVDSIGLGLVDSVDYSPVPLNTTPKVRRKSRRRLQWSMYERSSHIHSSNEIRYRSGETCHRQVSLGRTSKRPYCQGSYRRISPG